MEAVTIRDYKETTEINEVKTETEKDDESIINGRACNKNTSSDFMPKCYPIFCVWT